MNADIHSWHDFEDDKFVFGRTQDVEPILDANKAFQNNRQTGDFRLIASIPVVILERWIIEDGVNYLAIDKLEFSQLIRRKLRDPDWKWLRTSSGRV